MGDCLFPDHAGKQETGGTLESLIDHTGWAEVDLFHPRFPFQLQFYNSASGKGGSSTKVKEDKKKYTIKVLGSALIFQVC